MRIILAVTTLILIASVCYSLTIGKRTGFDYGIVVGGQTAFTQTTTTPIVDGDVLLLEIGDYLLLENGDKLLLE